MTRLYSKYKTYGPGEFVTQRGYSDKSAADVWSVSEPTRELDHHKYWLRGTYQDKEFKKWRRFRHFDKLRDILVIKYPALYVPPLPKKKAINNLSEDNTQERCFVLNRFIKQLVLCPYLLESEEFRVFCTSDTVEAELNTIKFDRSTEGLLERIDPYFFVRG